MAKHYYLSHTNSDLCKADELTWFCGIPDDDPFGTDRLWRHEIFMRYPSRLAVIFARQYIKTYQSQGRYRANRGLLATDQDLKGRVIHSTRNYDELEHKAKLLANMYSSLTRNKTPSRALVQMKPWIDKHGVVIPVTKSPETAHSRLRCHLWWRRQLFRRLGRGWEETSTYLGLVNRTKCAYVSDEGLELRISQKKRSDAYLSAMVAVNELGQEFTLKELQECSTSLPKNRRMELMVRAAGFEKLAIESKHEGLFITLTCPGRMHSSLYKSGDRNPKYDNTTPKEAQAYLVKIWARIRSRLKYYGIEPYGFRIAEPHHDATPHWHLLLFVDPCHVEKLLSIMRHYALESDPDEKGASKRRLQCVRIDWARGSATGYIAKYISKNIDGYGIDKDELGNPAIQAAQRVEAWAGLSGIRQFQQVGGPPVSVYRELRRLKESINESLEMERCRVAADAGDWAEYTQAQGGAAVTRDSLVVGLAKVWSDKPGLYGDPKGYVVIGVEHGIVTVQTRVHDWKIEISSLHTGEKPVVCEASSASGHGPLGGATASPRDLGAPVSRRKFSESDLVGASPLEYCQ